MHFDIRNQRKVGKSKNRHCGSSGSILRSYGPQFCTAQRLFPAPVALAESGLWVLAELAERFFFPELDRPLTNLYYSLLCFCLVSAMSQEYNRHLPFMRKKLYDRLY